MCRKVRIGILAPRKPKWRNVYLDYFVIKNYQHDFAIKIDKLSLQNTLMSLKKIFLKLIYLPFYKFQHNMYEWILEFEFVRIQIKNGACFLQR